ncbi:MAG: UvrD-helicase domain-containing protein [Desulfuromonadales bacterium]
MTDIQQIKVAISADFLKAFAAIPRDRQNAVMKFVSNFRKNPASPGSNYEKIQQANDPNMRSVRIDQNYRGIILKPDQGDVYCLLWVDKHDDAYNWAARHKAVIHPDLGSIQILETTLLTQEAPVQRSTDGVLGLFSSLKDRELIRLGVPQEAIPVVRDIVDEVALDLLQPRLPDEVFEALYLFAAGETYESLLRMQVQPSSEETVDTEDFSKALERDVTRRSFYVVTDDEVLNTLLNAPLELWRIFLHPSQRRLVERNWNGPVRVLGGAGTGKTVVAMHRAKYLAARNESRGLKPILLTTFSKTLAEVIRENLAKICSTDEMAAIVVTNLDKWAGDFLRKHGYQFRILYDENQRRELWNTAMAKKTADVDFPVAFFRAEFERVVVLQDCESVEDYLLASRVGRGGQLSRPIRKSIWPVFKEYRLLLRRANLREPEEAFRDASKLLKNQNVRLGICSVIVDEAQDFSPAALQLIRAMLPEGQNDLFIVGDAHQRIYRNKASLLKVGINVRGRGHRLNINYRTTDEIRRWAVAQLEGCSIDDLDDEMDTLRGYTSLSHGSHPEVLSSETVSGDEKIVLNSINRLTDSRVEIKNICLVARTKTEVDRYVDLLRRNAVPTLILDHETRDDRLKDGVRISTMHRVKGLEFDAVIIGGYRDPLYYSTMFSDAEDAGVSLSRLTNEKSLMHVAATRAKRYLIVSLLLS